MNKVIPIEDLVVEAKKDFIAYATTQAMGVILKLIPWLAGINPIVSFFVQLAVTWAVQKGEYGAFVLNTKVLTSDQAKDYRAAVAKRILAPEDIPDNEWEEIENEANARMVDLVRFSR